MAQGLIIDTASGAILRRVRGSAAIMALQVRDASESLFVVVDGEDCGLIQDGVVFVDDDGALAVIPGETPGFDPPSLNLAFVPT